MSRLDHVLGAVVEQLPIGVFVLDGGGRVLLWNAGAETLTGRLRAELLGRPVGEVLLDGPSTARILDELAAGRPFAGRFPLADARPDTLYFRAVPASLPEPGVLGVLQDVTDSHAGDEAFALLDALWETAPFGLAYFDPDLRYRRVNGAVVDIDGGTLDQRLGRTLESVHGAIGATIGEGLRKVLTDGRPRLDVPMRGRLWHGTGPLQEWRMYQYPVRSAGGEILGVGVVLTDVTAAERDRRDLARVAAQREHALNRYQSLIEATSVAVWVREADGSARRDAPGLRAITGQSLAEMTGWGFLDAVHPQHRAGWRAAWQAAVTTDAPEVFNHPYRLRTGEGTYRWFHSRAVPVRSAGHVVEWVGTETDVDDAVRARERLDLLANATIAMNAATEPDGELEALAGAVVPAFADVCRVYLLDPGRERDGVTGRRSISRTAPGLRESPMGDPRFVFGAGHPIARCARTATPVLVSFPDPTTPDWHPSDAQARWGTEIEVHSMLVAPVLSGGAVVAALLFVGCGDRARFTDDDRRLVGELAERASATVEKAAAFEQNRQVAVALQSAMLTAPPVVAGLAIKAGYLPAAANLAVGGDWYDAFTLAGGDLAVSVGDVAGHDLPAAAAMGQLRSMLRALADDASPPSAVVAALDRVATRLSVTRFTTLVHGRVCQGPDGVVFRWSNAGHPAPVLVPAGGAAEFLPGEVDVVLGVAPDSVRHDTEVVLAPGSTLVLYTDGLVERRRDPDDRAAGDLLRLIDAATHLPLAAFCDHLMRGTAADTDDDIVVLAVRVDG